MGIINIMLITNYQNFVNEAKKIWTINDPEYYGIKKYTWNNGKLDTHQSVNLSKKKLTKIPFNFGKVEGEFDCSQNPELTSLIGSPYEVTGNFKCMKNRSITNLEGLSKHINSFLFCSQNDNLTSLKGGENTICGYINISYNKKLTNLEYCPKLDGNFHCCYNESLISLKGGPTNKIINYIVSDNISLTKLDNCPYEVKFSFICSNNKNLINLEGATKIVGDKFSCYDIPSLKSIEDYPLSLIGNSINKINNFEDVCETVKNNMDLFRPLLDNKIKFHQMVMRLNPDLIKYYTTITPPSKKSILFDI